MRKFKVYRRKWGRGTLRNHFDFNTGRTTQLETFGVEMVPVMTINAKTPEAALRIAKQKGELAPIIGDAHEVV